MALNNLFEGIQSWQAVLGLLGTGATGGYFAHMLVGKIFDPEPGELKQRIANLESELNSSGNDLTACQQERAKFRDRLNKYDAVREALLGEEDQLWRLHPEIPPPQYFERLANSKTKIITIANHKGGVGKTTLSVNLAAYFEKRLDKRVLAIDLDYQGSLSTTLLKSVNMPHAGSLADDLLNGAAIGADVVKLAKTLQPDLPQTSVITANYELYQLENRLMLRWLLEEIETDIRYHLGSLLLSDEVQASYDVVLLDTPPRLTTAAVNALCASHHLIVPTIPDGMSVASVARFMQHAKDLQGRLNPALALAGVVVNLSRENVLKDPEKDALARVRQGLENLQIQPYIFERNIPRTVAVSGVAGEDVAYLKNKLFREGIMDKLGDEIAARIGFGVPA